MVRKTQTASFGSVLRESHSSKKFYSSKLFNQFKIPKNIEYVENEIKKDDLNRIYCKSSEEMSEIPDSSVHLMITSPPYNVGKEYDNDLSLDEYLDLERTSNYYNIRLDSITPVTMGRYAEADLPEDSGEEAA